MLLLDEWFREGKIPPLDMVECEKCGLHSKVSDCKWVMEQESWEMPEYKVPLCPTCGSDEMEYYPSEEYETKYWNILYGTDTKEDKMTRDEKLLHRLDNAKKRYEVKCQELDECSKFSTQQAIKILDFERRTCEWKSDEDTIYSTSCHHVWQFTEGDLKDNHNVRFCPYCGSRIVSTDTK